MIIPLLITAGVLGGIYAFAPRVAAPVSGPQPLPPPVNPGGVMPGSGELPADRAIRIDPDFASAQIRARVGNTIQMHGVSPRSVDNPEGYVFEVEPNVLQAPYTLIGLNEYRLVAPGRFTIRWAPNYVVTVEVSP